MWYSNTKQEVDTKDINLMEKEMEKESSSIKMVDIMRDNGRIIKCMDQADCSMREENQHMMEIGVKISLMDKEKYLMIIHNHQIVASILLTLITQKIIGSIIKECQSRIPKKEEEKLN